MNAPATHDSITRRLPYLTADLPGIGGEIKRFNEDFIVEELPRYAASGDGTHTYFVIEKSGTTTLSAIQLIARALGRAPHEVGYAGMKDAHGVTRQTLSIEHVPPERVAALELRNIRVLSVTRHTNKIKLGHLAGNRFEIFVRGAEPGSLPAARAIVERLASRGAPNYFGPQRFGARGDNALVGAAVLREDYAEAIAIVLGRPMEHERNDIRQARRLFDEGQFKEAADAWPRAIADQAKLARVYAACGGDARKAWRAVNHSLRKLYLSALQSDLFNQVLAQRIGALDLVEVGDFAYKHENGACFRVTDAEADRPRCASFEISPTGPIFGRRMSRAEGRPGQLEDEVLRDSGLPEDSFQSREAGKLDGGRRPLRVPLGEPGVTEGEDDHGPFLKFRFALPSGAYATSVMRELCKND
jgi:tRNA pseudouridine13 synthase